MRSTRRYGRYRGRGRSRFRGGGRGRGGRRRGKPKCFAKTSAKPIFISLDKSVEFFEELITKFLETNDRLILCALGDECEICIEVVERVKAICKVEKIYTYAVELQNLTLGKFEIELSNLQRKTKTCTLLGSLFFEEKESCSDFGSILKESNADIMCVQNYKPKEKTLASYDVCRHSKCEGVSVFVHSTSRVTRKVLPVTHKFFQSCPLLPPERIMVVLVTVGGGNKFVLVNVDVPDTEEKYDCIYRLFPHVRMFQFGSSTPLSTVIVGNFSLNLSPEQKGNRFLFLREGRKMLSFARENVLSHSLPKKYAFCFPVEGDLFFDTEVKKNYFTFKFSKKMKKEDEEDTKQS